MEEINILSKKQKKEQIKQAYHEKKIEKIRLGKITRFDLFGLLKKVISIIRYFLLFLIVFMFFIGICLIFVPDEVIRAYEIIFEILTKANI